MNELQRVGRIFTDLLHLAGSGLKWTGEAAKKAAQAGKKAEKVAAKAN